MGQDQLKRMKLEDKVVDNQSLSRYEDHEDAASLVRLLKIRRGR